jgi:hypothetical protein
LRRPAKYSRSLRRLQTKKDERPHTRAVYVHIRAVYVHTRAVYVQCVRVGMSVWQWLGMSRLYMAVAWYI